MNTEFKNQAYAAAKELIALSGLKAGGLLAVGCSSSEIAGEKIGTHSAPEVGRQVAEGILAACREAGVYLAAQCCEHLNRALIVERAVAGTRNGLLRHDPAALAAALLDIHGQRSVRIAGSGGYRAER